MNNFNYFFVLFKFSGGKRYERLFGDLNSHIKEFLEDLLNYAHHEL